MPHFKCVTCKTRLHDPDDLADLLDELCPSCGFALERAGDLAELVGFRAITTHDRAAEGGWAGQSHVDRLGDLRERRALQAQGRLDAQRRVDEGESSAAAAVASPGDDPVEPLRADALSQRQEMIAIRDRHQPRMCCTCQAPMARQKTSCWRCGTAWDAGPPTPAARERLDSLRARTGHVLDARAGRRAAARRRDRRPSPASAGRAAN